jgi:hypothetical protein
VFSEELATDLCASVSDSLYAFQVSFQQVCIGSDKRFNRQSAAFESSER